MKKKERILSTYLGPICWAIGLIINSISSGASQLDTSTSDSRVTLKVIIYTPIKEQEEEVPKHSGSCQLFSSWLK